MKVTDHEWNLFLYAHFTDIELSEFDHAAGEFVYAVVR